MKLSILIVNWNSKDYLRRCLTSVRSTCADVDFETIVVDAGSFDGCNQMLAEEFPEVTFIQSPDNLGFGRANNLGFKHVTGKALLLLNPDCELEPGAVKVLLNELTRLPDAGILGPRLLNTDGSLQTSCVQALPTPFNQALGCDLARRALPNLRLWGTGTAFRSCEPVAVEAVSGACMVLFTETYRRVGGFTPAYFMYGEDMDLCAKVGKLGLRIYHVPGAHVIHHGGGSSGKQGTVRSTVLLRESVGLFILRHQGARAAALYRLLMVCSSFVRLAALSPCVACRTVARRQRPPASWEKWKAVLSWSVGWTRTQPRRA